MDTIGNFAKNFEDSLIFFLIVTMKQAKMILVLEILKFDNTQSCPKFGRKLYSYDVTSASLAYLNLIFFICENKSSRSITL